MTRATQAWEQFYNSKMKSKFSTTLEDKFSNNELEFLAVVWAVEQFTNYFIGTNFQLVSDHKALATVLKGTKTIKHIKYTNTLIG